MAPQPLRIVHALRAPVGGLFRHVLDLAQGQASRGHGVGIVLAETAPGSPAEQKLNMIAPMLTLGISRIPMQRQVGLGDIAAVRHVTGFLGQTSPDVVHGHGAKGGAFARLARSSGIRIYTPHGGSLHYKRFTPQGMLYAVAERILARRTDLCLFESEFARSAYQTMIGRLPRITKVVHNGVAPQEFDLVTAGPDAADIVSVGELRYLKGIDVIIEAISDLAKAGREISAAIVGDGPDAQSLRDLVTERGLTDRIRFVGYQPARKAFGLGRLLIVASRAESLPYIVLEAAAAGVPILATRVGGIPEIFEAAQPLLPPGDPSAMARAIATALDEPAATRQAALRLRERVRTDFSQDAMVDGILAAYAEAIRFKFHRSP